jgi:hypothetical protein
MAQKVQVLLVCDLHEDEVEGVETLSFALDGSSYEIDACEQHAAEMRDAFAGSVGGAAPRRAARGPARPAASGSDRERVQAIREWARSNGHQVSERGRLSSSLIAAYEAAH